MNGSIVRQLILKDLYLMRWIVASSLAAGLAAIALMPLSGVAAYVGGVSLICIVVILNITLVMSTVVQERKDKVLLFILSLPISTTQYVAAKMASNAIAFVGSWVVLTLALVAVIGTSAIPDGILPFLIVVLTYLLMYYCVLLGVAVVTESSAWHATVITIGNVSVNFLIPLLLSRPSVYTHRTGAEAVWTGDLVSVIAIEAAVGVAALFAAFFVRSRTADFV